MVILMGIDMDHNVPDVQEAFEDELLDGGGNGMGLPHGHLRVHVELKVHDQVLA